MEIRRSIQGLAFLLGVLSLTCQSDRIPPFPSTEKRPVTTVYDSVKVIDDYLWLSNLNDPAVRAWNDEQNRYSRTVIDRFGQWQALYDQLKALYEDSSAAYFSLRLSGEHLFALKSQPPKNQPFLVVMSPTLDPATEHTVVDPNQLDTAGTTSIDWYVPSPGGKLVALSLSKNGSEDGSAYVFDVSTGEKLQEVVPRVQYPTAGGDIAWNPQGNGFFYTRFPQGSERPEKDRDFYQQIYYHRLGTPAGEDRYELGKEFPRIAEIRFAQSDGGRVLLASVANGDGGDFIHFLRRPEGRWVQITRYEDRVSKVEFGPDGNLYLLSHQGAPRGKILRMSPKGNLASATLVVPEGPASIEEFLPTAHRIYLVDIAGGPERIRYVEPGTPNVGSIPMPSIASAGGLVALGGDDLLFSMQTYFTPTSICRFEAASGMVDTTALTSRAAPDFSDAEVIREFATSKDSTKIPMNILRRKGTVLNGKNPTILYGYGGYGLSETPMFSKSLRFWLDHGGVYVDANLRGGGEYGEEWHEQGKLTKKQNVFDDFTACARWLLDHGYTSHDRLAIEGGSNGGLLMGAVLTQHPDLCRAVVSWVGIYDMLRSELFPNGEFNTTEFGTVTNPEEFKALYAYSPYHHVKEGTNYPAILMLTGDNDGRVDPANSRKMIARLQAATSSGLPVLLRTSSNAGHGIGTSLNEYISQRADVYAFLFQELGMTLEQK